MPWSAWRGSWHCEAAPASADLLSEAEDLRLLGSLEISWLLRGLPVCLPGWANNTGKGAVQETGGQQKASHSCVHKKPKRIRSSLGPPAQWDQCERLVAVELGLSARTYLEEALALSCFQLLAQ